VFSSDYNKDAQICYQAIHGEMPFTEDVRELNYKDLPDFDLLCGGFPCAKFSLAGDRMGFESSDARAQMFWELAKILEAKKPTMFWFENVKGLLNHDKGNSFRTILRKLDELGYNVEWYCPNAKDFGYPIIRERAFIVGHYRERPTKPIFPIKTHTYSYDKQTYVYLYRRGNFRRFEGYVPTLTASMGTGGNNVPMIIQKGQLRKLTPREVFRLQGISDSVIDIMEKTGLSKSALYERAGRTLFQPYSIETAKRIYASLNEIL
jgi:DNA (cytosine-5)-methyltransferase 1